MHSIPMLTSWLIGDLCLLVQAAAITAPTVPNALALETIADSFDTAPVWKHFWSQADEGFSVREGRLIASDGGRKSSHAAILTKRSFHNFAMQWTMVRLADKVAGGDGERAHLVAGVDQHGSIDNRKHTFWLDPTRFQINCPYAMRLVVLDGEGTLYWRRAQDEREEVLLTRDVPPEGRVGFRHYKGYEYAYDDVRITTFSGGGAPAPSRAAVLIMPNGVVRLKWAVAEELRGVFRFRIFRAHSPAMADKARVGETDAERFDDASAPAGCETYYQIVSLSLGGTEGPASQILKAKVGSIGRPGSVAGVFACPRRRGGVTVRWSALQGEPVKEYLVLLRAGGDAQVVGRRGIAAEKLLFVDPKGQREGEYGVAAVNAQGDRGPAAWARVREPKPLEFVGQELLDLLGVDSEELWAPPSVREVSGKRAGVRPHPRLVFTQEQIDQAKVKIKKHPWAKRNFEAILHYASQRAEVPPQKDTRATQACAFAYALTGQGQYAEPVRDNLIYWADRYRSLPLKHGEARVRTWQHGDSGWLSGMAVQPYDLIYHSPALSDGDRQHIENDLFKPMADDLMVNRRGAKSVFHTAHNFQAMRLEAVGLTGFCLNEEKYIRWAISEPYGFLQFVASQFNDDGFCWEKTISYHVTTGQPCLYRLAEAAYNNGLDLWHTPAPDTCMEDYGTRYPVDGDNGGKTLRLPLDALLYFMFPNHTGATFGDAVANRWYGGGFYYLAWLRYREPRYAWFNKVAGDVCFSTGHWPRLMWWDGTYPENAQFRIGTGRFANNGIAEHGSTLFPSTGYAVLRQDETDPAAPVLAFTYGPWGGGHNHGDRLAYILYARDALPVYRTSTYHQNQPGYSQYRRTSISYNTVIVDETSHRTGDNSRNPNTGRLDFFHGDPLLQAVGAHADVCYPDVFFRRALLLGPDCLVDVFICRSPNEHVYDYALHVDSDWEDTKLPAAAAGSKLGLGNGCQDVDVVARGVHASDYRVAWPFRTRDRSARLGFTLLGAPGTEINACLSPGCMKHKPLRSMFVARRRARRTVYVTVMEICDAETRITDIEPIEMAAGDSGGVRVGLRIRRPPFAEVVLYSETDEPHRFGDFHFWGRAAWVRYKGEAIAGVSVVQTRELQGAGLSMKYEAPTDDHTAPSLRTGK